MGIAGRTLARSGPRRVTRAPRLWAALFLAAASPGAAQGASTMGMFDGRTHVVVKARARPPVGDGRLELSRDRPAAQWAAPFCKRWSDGCRECSGSALEGEILCREVEKRSCVAYPVRCLDLDDQVAPLFCGQVSTECDAVEWRIDAETGRRSEADGQFCFSPKRHVEHVVDWRCLPLQESLRSCLEVGTQDRKGCLADTNAVACNARKMFGDLLRHSESVQAR